MTDHNHDFEIPNSTPDRDAPSGVAWHSAHRVLLIVAAAGFVLWILSGVYSVGASENAVVERCGEYLKGADGKISTVPPGIHMGLPWPLDRVEKIPMRQSSELKINTFEGSSPEVAELKKDIVGRGEMTADVFDARFVPALITADRNIVYAAVTVTYHIDDADAYLGAVAETEGEDLTARQKLLTRLIERQMTIIANHTLIDNLVKQRENVEKVLEKRIRDSFEHAGMGIAIDGISLTPPHVSEKIKPAFEAAIMASRDRDNIIADASVVAARRLYDADTLVSKIDGEARNYRERILAAAHGDADRFFNFYQQAYANPEVAWFKIWSETVRDVLKNASRVYFVRPKQQIYIYSPTPEKVLENPGATGGPGG
jgi:membrane protease subunit HflK